MSFTSFFRKKTKRIEQKPAAKLVELPDTTTQMPIAICRALRELRSAIIAVYRDVEGQPDGPTIFEDFEQRLKLIAHWRGRRLAEDLAEIESTVRNWHDRDRQYGEQLPDFRTRFEYLQRFYAPIIPSNETVAHQTATVRA